jgi:ATP-dependent protease ClpP protease subunit
MKKENRCISFGKLFGALMLSATLLFSGVSFAGDYKEPEVIIIEEVAASNPIHFLNGEYNGTLSALTFLTPKAAYMNLYSGITVGDYIKMSSDFIKLRDYTDVRDVFININSPGGSAFDALSISDLIDRKEAEGFIITAIATGIVASAAVPIFAVCDNRIVSDGAMFMVHEVQLWKRGVESASDIIIQGIMLTQLQERYADLMAANSNLSAKEWLVKMKGTTWFTAKDAIKWGLVKRTVKKSNEVQR